MGRRKAKAAGGQSGLYRPGLQRGLEGRGRGGSPPARPPKGVWSEGWKRAKPRPAGSQPDSWGLSPNRVVPWTRSTPLSRFIFLGNNSLSITIATLLFFLFFFF